MAALVLVSAYSGTLLSFMMSPVRRPVVDSIYDIPNVPGLKVALDRGRAADVRMELVSLMSCLLVPHHFQMLIRPGETSRPISAG